MAKPMNFYVTTESKDFLKKNFLNLRFFSLISVPDIVRSLGGDSDVKNLSDYNKFIANKTIIQQVDSVLKKKRYYSIIYSNPWIDYESIKNLREHFSRNPLIKNIIFLDDKDSPKHEDYWQLFEEVTFFPSSRKIRIVECENFKTPMFYWLNNMDMPNDLMEKYPDAIKAFSESGTE
jgi:hypothetical protein